MTKTQHKRTAVASMFQNGVSRNTKCAERDGFHREGHIYAALCVCNVVQYIAMKVRKIPYVTVHSVSANFCMFKSKLWPIFQSWKSHNSIIVQ